MARAIMSMATPKLMPISFSNSGSLWLWSLKKRQRGPLYKGVQLQTRQRNMWVHSKHEHEPTCACAYEARCSLILSLTYTGVCRIPTQKAWCRRYACTFNKTSHLHAGRFVAVLGIHALSTVFTVFLMFASTWSVQGQNHGGLHGACRQRETE